MKVILSLTAKGETGVKKMGRFTVEMLRARWDQLCLEQGIRTGEGEGCAVTS